MHRGSDCSENCDFISQGVYRLRRLPRVFVDNREPKLASGFYQLLWRRIGTPQHVFQSTSIHGRPNGARQYHFLVISALFLLLRWKQTDSIEGLLASAITMSRNRTSVSGAETVAKYIA
jgi:hypothetical protein